MSLAQLPTEVDTETVSLLNVEHLLAVCRTSKYWRRVAEPFLYEDIVFTVKDNWKFKVLLLALLRRPELAKSIKSIAIVPEWEGSPIDESDDVEGCLKAAQSASSSPWACLALILGFAPNVEVLDIQITRTNLNYVLPANLCYHIPDEDKAEGTRPLSKLKQVVWRGVKINVWKGVMQTWISLPARAEYLFFSDHGVDHFEYPVPQPDGYFPGTLNYPSDQILTFPPTVTFVPRLKALELDKVSIHPKQLLRHLGSSYFQKLERLYLCRMMHPETWYDDEIDYERFILALSERVTDLRELRFSVYWNMPQHGFVLNGPWPVATRFGDLKQFPQLKVVCAELGAMIDYTAEDAARVLVAATL